MEKAEMNLNLHNLHNQNKKNKKNKKKRLNRSLLKSRKKNQLKNNHKGLLIFQLVTREVILFLGKI